MVSGKARHYYEAAPLLVAVCILPFVVYGHFYEYSGEEFGLFIEGVMLSDFFSYTRALVFTVLGIYMTYRLIYEAMQGRMQRPCIIVCFCFAVLAVSLLISGAFALNKTLAFAGGYQRFEGVFTKLFYLVLALYSYYAFRSEEVREIVWKGTLVTAAVESVIGLAQMTGHDPFASPLVQHLILPADFEGAEISNRLGDERVYLTLANPNYASMYLAIMIIIVTWSLAQISERKWVLLFAAFDVLLFVELTATRSRTGILMLVVAALIWLIAGAGHMLNDRKKALTACLLMAVMLVAGIVTDRAMDLGGWDRIRTSVSMLGQERTNSRITGIQTLSNVAVFDIAGSSVSVAFGDVKDNEHLKVTCSDPSILEDISISVEDVDGEQMILVKDQDAGIYIAYDREMGYMVYAGNGYYEKAEDIPHVDMHGFESFASGRGYIWSRTIPLIRGFRILTGYGSDNFYLAFPQNDYAGKAQYCDSPYTIIEKPHSTYLLYAVENGMPAAIAFAVIIVALMVYCLRKDEADSRQRAERQLTAMLVAAFAVGFLFNDSSIVISPLFWIAVGSMPHIDK